MRRRRRRSVLSVALATTVTCVFVGNRWSSPTLCSGFVASTVPRRRAPFRVVDDAASVASSTTTRAARVDDADVSFSVGDAALSDRTFDELYSDVLPSWLLRRLSFLGYERPTLVQRRALDALLVEPTTTATENENHRHPDLILQAQTGSGKTLAYLLPALARVDGARAAVQALVAVPTRELGLQVARLSRRLCAGSGVVVMPVLQGSRQKRQRAWARAEPPHLAVGTPDELVGLVADGGLRYASVAVVVVDEVDACLRDKSGALHALLSRYLSPTYDEAPSLTTTTTTTITDANDEGRVVSTTSSVEPDALTNDATSSSSSRRPSVTSYRRERQTIFASATIPQHHHFVRLCVENKWTTRDRPPAYVRTTPGELLPPRLRHEYLVCADTSQKMTGLRRLVRKLVRTKTKHDDDVDDNTTTTTTIKALVFCDERRPMEEMARVLREDLSETTDDDDAVSFSVTVLRRRDPLDVRAAALDTFRRVDDDDDRPRRTVVRALLSTDLAARGLDVPDVTHVVHFDCADDVDQYAHRSGRAGRFGRDGTVVTLLSEGQEFVLRRLANEAGLTTGENRLRCVGRQKKKRNRRATTPPEQ